ncbi:MAG: S8 family serine peptidase [Verrucomicrobiia bacterium]
MHWDQRFWAGVFVWAILGVMGPRVQAGETVLAPNFLLLEEAPGRVEALDRVLAAQSATTLMRFGESTVFRVVQVPGRIEVGALWARLQLGGLAASGEADATRFNPWLRQLLDRGQGRQAIGEDEARPVRLLVKFRDGVGLTAGGRLHEAMGATFLRAFGPTASYQVVEVPGGKPAEWLVGHYLRNLMVERVWAEAGERNFIGDFTMDTLLVRFAEGVDEAARRLFAERHELEMVFESQLVPGVATYRVKRAGRSASSVVLTASVDKEVRFSEPDLMRYPCAVPNDPRFIANEMWGLRNLGGNGGQQGFDLQATDGWDLRNDASQVIVAVVDTGTLFTHEDLVGNLWRNPGEIPGNGIDDDGNGYIDDVHGIDTARGTSVPFLAEDDDGHGTHVAGTIGAVGNNGKGVTGVAWRAQLMLLKASKIFNPGERPGFPTAAILEAMEYAINNGATLANASFGGPGYSSIEEESFRAFGNAGLLVIAAAGNDNENLEQKPSYPASYLVPGVVSVAAATRQGGLADFSNFGSMVTYVAPGDEIVSTLSGSDSDYGLLSGTSMAAPHITGIFALAKARYPQRTNLELAHHLFRNSTRSVNTARKLANAAMPNLFQVLRNRPAALSSPRSFVNSTPLDIPVVGTVTSTLQVPITGPIGLVTLDINGTHTFLSDLTFALVSPSGKEAIFRFPDPSSGPFTVKDAPAWIFTGEDSIGEWKLRVTDGLALDSGAITSWGLTIRFRELAVDEDLTPRIGFVHGRHVVNADDGGVGIQVRRTGTVAAGATVSYSTRAESAVPGVHFMPVAGDLVFAPDERIKLVEIPVMNSGQVELQPRTFWLDLSQPLGGVLGLASTQVVIPRHNLGFFEFAQPTYVVTEGQGVLRVTINRRAYQGEPATVDFFTSDGTARGGSIFAGGDFEHVHRRVLFFPGVPAMTVEVPIHADGEFEMDEQFFIHLSRPTNSSSLGNPRTVPVTIKDGP